MNVAAGDRSDKHGAARPPPDLAHLVLDLAPQVVRRHAARLCGHAGHAGAAEPVEHDVARLGVVEEEPHDRRVRHLRRVRVRLVEGVRLALGDVGGERARVDVLAVVVSVGGRRRQPVGEVGVGAGGVVRRQRHGDDVGVVAERSAGQLRGARAASRRGACGGQRRPRQLGSVGKSVTIRRPPSAGSAPVRDPRRTVSLSSSDSSRSRSWSPVAGDVSGNRRRRSAPWARRCGCRPG